MTHRAQISPHCVSKHSTGPVWRGTPRPRLRSNPSADNDPLLVYARGAQRTRLRPSRQGLRTGGARGAAQKGSIPARLKGQVILMAGYCSAIQNDTVRCRSRRRHGARGRRRDVARPRGARCAVDQFQARNSSRSKQVSLLDYRIAERVGGLPHKVVLEKGEPALLVALATDPSTPIDLGLPATEAAARLNALTPNGTCRHLSRQCGGNRSGDDLAFGSADRKVSPAAPRSSKPPKTSRRRCARRG